MQKNILYVIVPLSFIRQPLYHSKLYEEGEYTYQFLFIRQRSLRHTYFICQKFGQIKFKELIKDKNWFHRWRISHICWLEHPRETEDTRSLLASRYPYIKNLNVEFIRIFFPEEKTVEGDITTQDEAVKKIRERWSDMLEPEQIRVSNRLTLREITGIASYMRKPSEKTKEIVKSAIQTFDREGAKENYSYYLKMLNKTYIKESIEIKVQKIIEDIRSYDQQIGKYLDADFWDEMETYLKERKQDLKNRQEDNPFYQEFASFLVSRIEKHLEQLITENENN